MALTLITSREYLSKTSGGYTPTGEMKLKTSGNSKDADLLMTPSQDNEDKQTAIRRHARPYPVSDRNL